MQHLDICTHHKETFLFRSSLTEKGEITWAFGNNSSSTFGGGPSGEVSDQRVTSDASTTCGFAPRGSMMGVVNSRYDYSSSMRCASFAQLRHSRSQGLRKFQLVQSVHFAACMWCTVWPSHDSAACSDLWWWCALIGIKDPDFFLTMAWFGSVRSFHSSALNSFARELAKLPNAPPDKVDL